MSYIMKAVCLLVLLVCILILSFNASGFSEETVFELALGGAWFDTFLQDSIANTNTSSTSEFYAWLNSKLLTLKIPAGLQDKSLDSETRTSLEIALAKELHSWIKKSLPRYSLVKGFELTNASLHSQRQCFLQAVLLNSILHGNKVKAAIAMVNVNEIGEETNNGHAIVIIKLSNGNDIILDGSEPRPFLRHQGLFICTPNGYLYAKPVYIMNSYQISYYNSNINSSTIPTSYVKSFDFNFLRSQFYYYRGEQVKNGSIADKPTKKGLAASESYLKTAYQYCPANPLVSYLLAKTYTILGDENAAKWTDNAKSIYASYGWIPPQLK